MPTATTNDVTELAPLNTKKGIAIWINCTTRHVDNLVKAGKFPQPIRIGTHPRWRRSDLLEWLESQSATDAE